MKRQPRILAGTAIGLLMASAPLGAFPLSGKPLDSRFAPLILAQEECRGRKLPAETGTAAARATGARREQARAGTRASAGGPAGTRPQPEPSRTAAGTRAAARSRPNLRPNPKRLHKRRLPSNLQLPNSRHPSLNRLRRQSPHLSRKPPAEQAPRRAGPGRASARRAGTRRHLPSGTRQAPQNKRQPSRHLPKKPRQNSPLRMLHSQRPRLLPANSPQNSLHRTRPRRKPLQLASSPPSSPANSLHSLASSRHSKVEAPADPNAAPILDSQKEAAPAQPGGTGSNRLKPANSPHQQANSRPSRASRPRSRAPVDQGPPPESDAAAQAAPIAPEQIQPVIAEEGQRIDVGNTREERLRFRQERRERRQDAEVIEEFNDNRTIIQINNQTYIDSPDYDRIIRDRDDVYYEELPRGRIREVVDAAERHADRDHPQPLRRHHPPLAHRARQPRGHPRLCRGPVLPGRGNWRDPGLDLPPMRLDHPARGIHPRRRITSRTTNSTTSSSNSLRWRRSSAPIRSTEVKRSARIRDKVRRIDIDTLTFEFGSASIAESEIPNSKAWPTRCRSCWRRIRQKPS